MIIFHCQTSIRYQCYLWQGNVIKSEIYVYLFIWGTPDFLFIREFSILTSTSNCVTSISYSLQAILRKTLVTLTWVTSCTQFFYICLEILLHIFLHSLAFPRTIAVGLCFCEHVRFIWQLITNLVHSAELPALWMSGDRNFELWQSPSDLKKDLIFFRRNAQFRLRSSKIKTL